MSIHNEYGIGIMATQRQHELQAEAAQERLARIARGDQRGFWQRIFVRRQRPTAAEQPRTTPVIRRRWAH